jgi:hypothetical protein
VHCDGTSILSSTIYRQCKRLTTVALLLQLRDEIVLQIGF